MTDHYKTLGVAETATAEEIKKAYRKLAKRYHPDATGGDKAKLERFKEISEAYNTLSDLKLRAEYDRTRRNPFSAGGGQPPPGFDAFRDMFNRGRADPRTGDAGFGFGDLFGDVFAGRGTKAQQAPETTLKVRLSFEEAALGVTKPLSFRIEEDSRRLTVRIPPGAADGTRMRLSGQGVRRGGVSGDLVLEIGVDAHPHFHREGHDVILDLPVTFEEAILGAKIEVPTLDGKATISIPPGTSSGVKLRLRGKGVARSDGTRGDEYVVVRIVVPKPVPERLKAAVQHFAEETRGSETWNPRNF